MRDVHARRRGALTGDHGSARHSKISVTMNTYTHVLPGLRQEAADAIDELFGRDDGPLWQQ
jgi:hypothetical protein